MSQCKARYHIGASATVEDLCATASQAHAPSSEGKHRTGSHTISAAQPFPNWHFTLKEQQTISKQILLATNHYQLSKYHSVTLLKNNNRKNNKILTTTVISLFCNKTVQKKKKKKSHVILFTILFTSLAI